MVTEGDSNIVISVPGDDGEQARELGATAQLRFRPVLGTPGPPPRQRPTALRRAPPRRRRTARPRPPLPLPRTRRRRRPSPPDGATPTDAATPTDGSASGPAAPEPGSPPVTEEEAAAQFATLTCEAENVTGEVSRPNDYVAACSEDGTVKYLLGPTIIEGTEIADGRGHQPGHRRVDRAARLQVQGTNGVGGVHRRERRQERGLHPRRSGHLRAVDHHRDQRSDHDHRGLHAGGGHRAGQPAPVRRPSR